MRRKNITIANAVVDALYIILNSHNNSLYYYPHITVEETRFLEKLNYNMLRLRHLVKYGLQIQLPSRTLLFPKIL